MNSINLTYIFFGIVLLMSVERCDCYRILGVFPMNARSHFAMFQALMKGLARRGHQVDVVSTFPLKNPVANYTDIIILPVPVPPLDNSMTYEKMKILKDHVIHWVSTNGGNNLCSMMGHSQMQELIKNPPQDPPYDLVIIEYFLAPCYMALSRHLNVSTVGAISSAFYPWNHRPIANPDNLAFVPNNFNAPELPMDFWKRLFNTVYANFNEMYTHYLTRNLQDAMLKEYLGENVPSVRELERNVALVLANSHHSFNGPMPKTSALIEVGGLHIQDNVLKLPEDIENWLDQSTDGFILFTFGSLMRIESLPENVLRIFYKLFEKISPTRVLMRVADPKRLLPGLPKNVRVFQWVTQLKVLQHKNIKAFITHGGMMGTQEAIHSAVPMIVMPFFIDQHTNANLIAQKKIGIKLNIDDITEKDLDNALSEILYNPIYKQKMLQVSAQFWDRPMTPMDEAIWWIEYVVRHGDKDIRSPALDLYWWQIELLDVYAVILVIITLLIFIIITLLRLIRKKLYMLGKRSKPKRS